MTRTVAIHQPNYAPWCGYFTKIKHANVFIFLDDVQMPRGSYVYRTQIRATEGSKQWLSVPTHSSYGDPIRDVLMVPDKWPAKHVQTLRSLYGRCANFKEVFDVLMPIYEKPGKLLADFNMGLIIAIANYLGIEAEYYRSSDLKASGTGDDRLISLVQMVSGNTYLSGQGGQNYQSPEKFSGAGLVLEVRTYRPAIYAQRGGSFIGGLSVLDALFNIGRKTTELLEYPQSIGQRRAPESEEFGEPTG